MKKILFVLFVSIFAVSFSACNNEKENALKKIKAQTELINSKCPMQCDKITTWESMDVTDSDIVYNYTVADTEDGQIINALKDNLEDQKEFMLSALKQQNDFMTDYQPLMIKGGLGLKYVYTSAANGEKVEIVFTPEEIANM